MRACIKFIHYTTLFQNIYLFVLLDLKKKVELETNELRDKMQFDKKVKNYNI